MKRGISKYNCLLAINKPKGITSHDVVARVRRSIGERRVGHAGTLDPAAEGVLIVGIGQATKLMGYLTLDTKSYIADIIFGSETDTEDSEGEVTKSCEIDEKLFDEVYARELLAQTLGKQEQVPPIYSAISVDGKRAYAAAREGMTVELKARPIEVFEAALLGIQKRGATPIWTVAYSVSKGTYIRSLARDLGRMAKSLAHLDSLVRTASGEVTLKSCVSLEALEKNPKEVLESSILDPVDAIKLNLKVLSESEFEDVSCGRKLNASDSYKNGERIALIYKGLLVGIWEVRTKHLYPICNMLSGISGVKAQ